jgi:hypothetical protein
VQWIVSIPVLIALIFSAAVALLRLGGVPVQMVDPITAGVIMSLAGIIGAVPPLRHAGDASGTLFAGLLGTILHLVASIVLTIAAVLLHLVDGHGRFLFWLFGGYWISMLTLIWLARGAVTAKALKVQN